jgi:hypothetical protein
MGSTRDEFSMSGLDRVVEVLALLALLACGVLVLLHWFTLPDSIPMHFGLDGSPDRYGSKYEQWILLGVFALTYLSMALPARAMGMTRRAKGQQWVTTYWPQMRLLRSLILWFNVETMVLFLALLHGTQAVALGRAAHLNPAPMYWMCGVMAITAVIWMALASRVSLRQLVNPKR